MPRDSPRDSPRPLPDPRSFDPVSFPGQTEGEAWPPAHFDFTAPWILGGKLAFERDASGEMCVVRRFEHLRLVVPFEAAHRMLELAPGGRDFRLLRLVPAALRFVEVVTPGDPVPLLLRDAEAVMPADHHLYAATTSLMEALARQTGEEGRALSDAIRRVQPGRDMFERALVHCVTVDGLSMEWIAPVARRLQRLTNAHARVLAAVASQPGYASMERIVGQTRRSLAADRRWASDLLTHALVGIEPILARPRLAAELLQRQAEAVLRRGGALGDIQELVAEQDRLRDRLHDLSTFWQRLVAAWLSVHPETTDRREIEALTRNTIRRLGLRSLYLSP
ncbi:FUSC family protein [Muricoccus roseus]|uniref:hypothetical protein n=1 Tax=Muricoccus roseus TaxID=198092 RepID=UPI0009348ED9|nr:hypothetical protein [Roseomonas rosea]